jgi:molybdenum cofactor cytidylyltransferase
MKDNNCLTSPEKFVAVVLAAGKGSRFGGDKVMAILPSGERVIDVVMEKVARVFDDYVCVVRKEDHVLQHHLQEKQWQWVIAETAGEGMSHSLIGGLEVFPNAAGWLFVLADMPYVLESTFVTLKGSLEGSDHLPKIVIPHCSDQAGNPIGLSRHFGAELRQLSGDVGARSIVKKNSQSRLVVDVQDKGIFHDIDVPSDLV